MQREHPSRVRRAPPDRDYDSLTTKRARLELQDGTNSGAPTDIGPPPPTQMQTLASTSISKSTLAPRKKHSPASIKARSKKSDTASAHPKTVEKVSAAGAQETEAEDTPTEAQDSDAPTDVMDDAKEDLEEETAEKELG